MLSSVFFVVCSEVLSEEMLKACAVYAQWLVDASKVTEDDKVKYGYRWINLQFTDKILMVVILMFVVDEMMHEIMHSMVFLKFFNAMLN